MSRYRVTFEIETDPFYKFVWTESIKEFIEWVKFQLINGEVINTNNLLCRKKFKDLKIENLNIDYQITGGK